MSVSVRRANLTATLVGVGLLIALVTGTAAAFESEGNFWFLAIAGYLFTVPFALSAWHGSLWKSGRAPRSPRDWLGVFCVSATMSTLFILIDLAVVHPGFSLIFTFAAVSMTFIALPSAVRAWVVEFMLAGHYEPAATQCEAEER